MLPILPTTPFVLAGVACLGSTPKLQEQVLRVPFFREYIENYRLRRGLSRKTVAKSLIFLWGMLLFAMYRTDQFWLLLLLPVIGICVTIHILQIAKPRGEK